MSPTRTALPRRRRHSAAEGVQTLTAPTPGGKIVVLGGGITGLASAWQLAARHGSRVVLLEREETTGGLASTISHRNILVDIGSHRIHPAYDPEAFAIVRRLLGNDLLQRPRRGLILINGKVLKYPPSIFQICRAFGLRQTFFFARDYVIAHVTALFLGRDERNFAKYIVRSVGTSLYEIFYKPYARKLWGVDPDTISFEPAMNRVKKFELDAFLREISNLFRRRKADPVYYYPQRGIGEIGEKIKEKFLEAGGEIRLLSEIKRIDVEGDRKITAIHFRTPQGQDDRIDVERLVSTIPLETLHSLIDLKSDQGRKPSFDLRMRSLRICYLVTTDRLFAESETLYVPDPRFRLGRVSEIKKYSPAMASPDEKATVLTVEVICDEGDDVWTMDDAALARFCADELQRMGVLRSGSSPREFFSRRIRNLYPIYEIGWKKKFDRLYDRLDVIENLHLVGRPALFLHCNIDHCIVMALRLAEHLDAAPQDKAAWRRMIENFFRFQVKD